MQAMRIDFVKLSLIKTFDAKFDEKMIFI